MTGSRPSPLEGGVYRALSGPFETRPSSQGCGLRPCPGLTCPAPLGRTAMYRTPLRTKRRAMRTRPDLRVRRTAMRSRPLSDTLGRLAGPVQGATTKRTQFQPQPGAAPAGCRPPPGSPAARGLGASAERPLSVRKIASAPSAIGVGAMLPRFCGSMLRVGAIEQASAEAPKHGTWPDAPGPASQANGRAAASQPHLHGGLFPSTSVPAAGSGQNRHGIMSHTFVGRSPLRRGQFVRPALQCRSNERTHR